MDSKLSAKLVSLFLVLSVCLLGYTAMSTWGAPTPTPGKVAIDPNIEFKQGDNVSYFFADDTYLDKLELTETYIKLDDKLTMSAPITTPVDITIGDYSLGTEHSSWSVNSDTLMSFTLSGLESGTTYKVYIDDVIMATMVAAGGQISFDYSAWSTHTFDVIVPTTYIAPNDVPPSEKSPSSSDPGTTSFSWTNPALIAIVSFSILIALLLLLRRPRGRSGTRHN